ncbi:flagellar filament capping protein FliD [Pollutimonas bauzanensis]|uniref:Flagellar hook-associated protein 2 n=1 Tax=Pollutimonas bauzanensis TaxID=658167 RepID=A0A1M5Z435_9BURK|nr:flagellar filament capping protein FliD [Pollutimonas bauzanensis]SHI18941.1 flagellar hook-associated protein 2 [Pollutimonas bauzanensis]
MAISSIGVGSGLPLSELLENLRTNEELSLGLIESRATAVQNRLSGYGTIKSSIEALKTASDALGKAETFGALKTTVSGDAFTASASAKGIAGQYRIEVQELATAQTLTSAGQTNRKAALADGKVGIEIKLAGNAAKTLTLDSADTSLEGIAKAINSDSSLGVSATLINDGSVPPKSYLLLTAKETGEKASIERITVTDAGAGTDVTALQNTIGFVKGSGGAPNTGALTEQAAKNASLLVNGIQITSQSNTVEDAIDGVTLTLLKKNEAGSADTLSITKDDSVASKAINTFVSAYNNLQSIIKTLTSYDVDNQKSSALTGDSLARNVQSQVRGALNAAGTGAVRTLAQLGITTSPTDGTLKVDDDKLAAALKDNMVDVQSLFAGENGISKQLGAVADTYVKSGGLINSAADSMTDTLKQMNKQYQAESDRIDARMENYRKQFTALDTAMAQMNSVSSYLTQQLAMLSNLNDQS